MCRLMHRHLIANVRQGKTTTCIQLSGKHAEWRLATSCRVPLPGKCEINIIRRVPLR